MDSKQTRVIESLQDTHARQRKVIQQLQIDNAQLLSDLVDIRQERDRFRNEAARVRKENAELQNRLEEVLTKYQDLKRELATLVRSLTVSETYCQCGKRGRSGLNRALQTTLPVLDEGEAQDELTPVGETITGTVEREANPQLRQYHQRELPDPLKSRSPVPEVPVSAVISPSDESRHIPATRVTLSRSYSTR
ncbi:hypothetical protein JVU11DRAFT_7809 [Chiua virens]|nr:hypothetical protein JVU11DRAFT_7809 [Chiua virens]